MRDEKIVKVKSNISNILELPKDILLDLPRITLIGNLQISIQNHKGIVEYSNENIRIKMKNGIVKISGIELTIKNIVTEEIIIYGKISSIDFYM